MRVEISHPLLETAAGAEAERIIKSCVHCGMCNAVCPTYQMTGDELDGPRGRIYLIKEVLETGRAGAVSLKHLDRCLTCRSCETACPSGVPYHHLLEIGRDAVEERIERPPLDRVTRATVRFLVLRPAFFALALSLGRALKGILPGRLRGKITPAPPRIARAPAAANPEILILGGCVQAAAAPHFNAAASRVFARAGRSSCTVDGCCGAVSAHLSAPEEARRIARRNIDRWIAALDAGAIHITSTASGCAAFVRDYPALFRDNPVQRARAERVAAALADPVQILTESPPQAISPPRQARIAVHESCTLVNGPGLGGKVGALLSSLGYEVAPVVEAPRCCGSAGAYSLFQPEIAGQLGDEKWTALTTAAPDVVVTANIGCWMHLGERADRPILHWLEAVDAVT